MSIQILAVDDSRSMRDLIRYTLMEAGFEVHLAEDGVHGMEVLGGIAPDVIITDINMPRMDGFGFIEAVRKTDAHMRTPILTLTTESGADLKARAREAGATGWIVKPFNKDKLISVIRRVAA